jgi:hypothetical protein
MISNYGQKSCHNSPFDEVALLRPIIPGYAILHPQGSTGKNKAIFGRMSIFNHCEINTLFMILPNRVESAYIK